MKRTRRASRPHGDEGFAGTVAGVILGFLVLAVGTLVVANVWAVVDTKSATTEAARAGARSYVEAPDASAAAQDAILAARSTLEGLGRDPSLAHVSVVSGSFSRCGRITISVSYPAPLISLPVIGDLGKAETVKSLHSELVDPYRSGLPGVAACV